MRIQRKQEKGKVLPSVENETLQNSPFDPQQDIDQGPFTIDEVDVANNQPRDADTREFMELRFDHDFSKLPIHADRRSSANEGIFYPEHAQRVARLTDVASTEEAMRPEGGPLSSNLAASIQAERGNGSPLNAPVREQMEQAFGTNFSDVRLHADSTSHEFNHNVGAQAFTVGSDIFLGPRTSPDETQVLAHELTHVVQQRNMSNGGPMVVGPAGDHYEREADIMSATIGANVSPAREDGTDGAHQVQRISEDASLNPKAGATHIATGGVRQSGTGALIQRKTDTEQRLENLEQHQHEQEVHQKAQDTHQKASDLDQLWLTKFDKQFSSYHETINRISAGLQAASKGFQEAQKKQAETDAMAWKAIGAMLILAGGFEWAFAPGLGKLLGATDETAEHILSVAHAGADIALDITKEHSQKENAERADKAKETSSIPGAQTPAGAAGGDPVAFLTSNSAALENQRQKILNAFIQRSMLTRNFSDDDWSKFDLAQQETKYQQLYDELRTKASDADKLKDDKEIALVLERHFWSKWISAVAEEVAKLTKDVGILPPVAGSGEESEYSTAYSLGSDIEKRLNEIKLAQLAGVELSEHWYSSNSPDNWTELLLRFARNYNEGINK